MGVVQNNGLIRGFRESPKLVSWVNLKGEFSKAMLPPGEFDLVSVDSLVPVDSNRLEWTGEMIIS